MAEGDVPFRVLPRLDDANEAFWQSGRDGVLRFFRCADCALWLHPPAPICPACGSAEVAPQAVSGRAEVLTFTVNHQAWMPGPEIPYVVAIVAIEEDPRVRLTTNIVDCDPSEVRIGMGVEVCFEHHADPGGDVWLPLFRPARGVD